MGCHTWFYVHLPEKKDRWAELYIKYLQDSARDSVKMWEDEPDSEWEEMLKTDLSPDSENHKYWLTFDEEKKESLLKEGWSKEAIEQEVEYHKCNTWQDVRDFFVNLAKKNLEASEKLNNLNDLLDNKSLLDQENFECPFEIINNKIYVETSFGHLSNDWPELSKDLRHAYDVFRIHDYDAKDCYSLKDCEERYMKYCNEPLPKEAKEFIEQYYKDFPDTIIRFG